METREGGKYDKKQGVQGVPQTVYTCKGWRVNYLGIVSHYLEGGISLRRIIT